MSRLRNRLALHLSGRTSWDDEEECEGEPEFYNDLADEAIEFLHQEQLDQLEQRDKTISQLRRELAAWRKVARAYRTTHERNEIRDIGHTCACDCCKLYLSEMEALGRLQGVGGCKVCGEPEPPAAPGPRSPPDPLGWYCIKHRHLKPHSGMFA